MFNAPLHAAIEQARVENIVGNILFTILGGCVLFTITFWLIK